MKKTLIVLAALAMVAGFAQADTIVSVADGSGLEVADGAVTATALGMEYLQVGTREIEGDTHVGIAFLPLPTLTGGTTISTANLDLGLTHCNWFGDPWNIDLYALGVTDTPARNPAAQFYVGANDAGNTKIQDNFIVNLTESPWQWPDSTHSTDSAGDANLASWLQSQYTGTTPNAAYAILRLNPDAVPVGTYRGVRIKSSDAAYGDSPEPGEIRPTLTVETIPEPATIGLLGLAGLGAMIARRLRLG